MKLHTDTQVFPLKSVDGFIAIDLLDAPACGGGTRLAPDVSEAEARLLARAMSYKFAVAGLRVGGAKVVLRAHQQERAAVLERFRREIAPWLASGRLMTGPDLGTSEQDFAGLPVPGGQEGITAGRQISGIPAEEFMTGYAAAAAIGAAVSSSPLADLHGMRVALEGFGKIGSGVAQHIAARGGKVVAVSTIAGCVLDPLGLPVHGLLAERERHGDALIHHVGGRVASREALWGLEAEVVVPGARTGIINAQRASLLATRHVVPIANAPYTERGLAAHADFIVSGGGAMAYLHPSVSHAENVEAALAALERLMCERIVEAASFPDGPYAGAVRLAQAFLACWRGAELPVPEPPLAQED
jgi:glutamate dehydrogenase (NAD(P)+)